MDGSSDCSNFGAKPVSPRSPPGSIDLYGKRTQMFKVQALEREISLLQEELKSVEGLQPASRYCKEVDDFVGAKQDPLVTKCRAFSLAAYHASPNASSVPAARRILLVPSVTNARNIHTRLAVAAVSGGSSISVKL
ncbi:hypothetical protein PTKIN_Ptkin18bG0079500 [Pterospermum kingtungense]